MEGQGRADVTTLLAGWQKGDPRALDRLVAAVYPELRRLAHLQLGRRRPGETLVSAALANEAYLKLVRAGGIECENRSHFLALCAQLMRRILVDHARERGAAKRGGGEVRVPLEEAKAPPSGAQGAAQPVDVLALDEALDELARIDPRKSRVIELRYFGGLTFEETADVLGVSVDTAKRDWRLARAWLRSQLTSR